MSKNQIIKPCLLIHAAICLWLTVLLAFVGQTAASAAPPLNPAPDPSTKTRHTFTVGETDFLFDEKPVVLRSGEIHYPRTPHEYWRDRLRKAKAMGLNTVCTYVFWNVHEPRRGEWDFSGDADIVRFCKIAQEEGLWVILRPGPYICTEWDFGGYPGWLLADRTTRVRTTDPKFTAPARQYILKIGEQLRDLQVTRGGPIILVQVENEYGSFGSDIAFKKAHADWLREAGFDVPLFTSDGPGAAQLKGGTLPGITATVNFGGGAKGAFESLKKFRHPSPRMIGEFWVGWFDAWGKKHITTRAADKARELDWALQNGVSVNIYMFHGGTNFGFMAGANGNQRNDFVVDTTSYDYSAVLDEAGNPTDKYWRFREVIQKNFPGEKLPAPPEAKPLQKLPPIRLTPTDNLDTFISAFTPVRAVAPKTMEQLEQSLGFTLYRTTVRGPLKGTLDLAKVRDYAVVLLDGKRVGVLDRRLNQHKLELTIPENAHTLDILVENLARINFGRDMLGESKGLVSTPTLAGKTLTGWEMWTLPLDSKQFAYGATSTTRRTTTPAVPGNVTFWRAQFDVADTKHDTFLDVSTWGKGVVWVNGHNLGRLWNIGPQQSLYLPAAWLLEGRDGKPSRNEIIVLSLDDPAEPLIQGLDTPRWGGKVNTAQLTRKPGQTLQLDAKDIVKTGAFADGDAWQDIAFERPLKARYLAIEALNAHDEKDFAAITELVFLDANGAEIPREECSVVYADSEEIAQENGSAKLVLDNQPTTWWHTQWSDAENPDFPHHIVIDLGGERTVSGFRYQPRQGNGAGKIKDYRIYLRTAPFAGL